MHPKQKDDYLLGRLTLLKPSGVGLGAESMKHAGRAGTSPQPSKFQHFRLQKSFSQARQIWFTYVQIAHVGNRKGQSQGLKKEKGCEVNSLASTEVYAVGHQQGKKK